VPVDPETAWLEERPKPLSVDAVLASAAVPTVFEGVRLPDDPGGPVHEYWDGLFSQNPPVRNLLDGPDRAGAKPDEIWLVRINPRVKRGDFSTLAAIADRRNELSGNISLNQELGFIEQVNDWIESGKLPADEFTQTEISRIQMGKRFHCSTKVDRSQTFLDELRDLGHQRAREFLADRKA